MNNEEKISKMKEYLEKFIQQTQDRPHVHDIDTNEDDSEDDNSNENSVDNDNGLTTQDKMFMMLIKSHFYICKMFYSYF